MDPTTEALLGLAKALHISPVAASVWIPLIIIFSNRIAKLIPDNATGPLKYVRLVMVVLGIKVSNNTGVAPVQDSQGKIIERSEPESDTPVAGTVEVSDAATEGKPEPVQKVFQQGAAALESKDQTNAG